MYRLLAAVWGTGSIFFKPSASCGAQGPCTVLESPAPLKTCGSVKLLCSKPSISRMMAFREISTHLGEKSKPLFLLELTQLVLYSPPSSSPLLSFGELQSLHLAFLSVIACIKITASADYS